MFCSILGPLFLDHTFLLLRLLCYCMLPASYLTKQPPTNGTLAVDLAEVTNHPPNPPRKSLLHATLVLLHTNNPFADRLRGALALA